MTHSEVWARIDKVAELKGITASALAIRCRLDATSFNKSKRFTAHGQPRWPSSCTLAKVIECSGLTDDEFFRLPIDVDNGRTGKDAPDAE